MKALTLHQPWASLIALGVKTIETRAWSTKYRGPLAIHAGRRIARMSEGFDAWRTLPEGSYEATRSTECPSRFPPADQSCDPLPLGAIVATCELVDVVPIIDLHEPLPEAGFVYCDGDWLQVHDGPEDSAPRYSEDEVRYGDFTPGRYAWLLTDIKPTTERCPACLAQPDFQRSASIIAADGSCPACRDEGKCDPVPAKGKQGLWEWVA